MSHTNCLEAVDKSLRDILKHRNVDDDVHVWGNDTRTRK